MADEKNSVALFTPKRRPLSFECGRATVSDQLVKVLQCRLKTNGRVTLTKHQDEEFLMGVAAVFSLRYAADILKLVRESDEVEMVVEER